MAAHQISESSRYRKEHGFSIHDIYNVVFQPQSVSSLV
jgi:hypothetical protein